MRITEIEDTSGTQADFDVDDKDAVLRRLYCHSLPFSSCRGDTCDYECRRLTKILDKRVLRQWYTLYRYTL